MGRKMNNMPVRKKKLKDPNNFQIQGKAGLGRTRTKCRLQRQKAKTKKDVQIERGQLPDETQERGRPESYVSLAKRQEDRVSAEGGEAQPQEESKRSKRKRRNAEDKEPESDLLEKSHLPQAGVRSATVELNPGEDEGALASKRPKQSKQHITSYCPSFCSSGVCGRNPVEGELWPRAAVRLAGLQAAPELNGRTASCSSWDGGKERWLVQLHTGRDVKAIKAANLRLLAAQDVTALRPGSSVQICGLKGEAATNGEMATCMGWDKTKAMWMVRLQNGDERQLRPENLKLAGTQEPTLLRVGSSVCLVGLQAAPELNGKLGTCGSWDADKQRWVVKLQGGLERLLKPENLEVDTILEGLLVSPLVRQTAQFCPVEEKLDHLVKYLKGVRVEERKGLRPRSLVVIFCKDVESLRAARAGLIQAQLPCVTLHREQSQAKRDGQLASFRLDKRTLALVTDPASHGLKREHLRCVVMYDFPKGIPRYGDRIRRILSEGAEGYTHTLFTKESAQWAPSFVSILDASRSPVDDSLRNLATQGAGPPKRAARRSGRTGGRAKSPRKKDPEKAATEA